VNSLPGKLKTAPPFGSEAIIRSKGSKSARVQCAIDSAAGDSSTERDHKAAWQGQSDIHKQTNSSPHKGGLGDSLILKLRSDPIRDQQQKKRKGQQCGAENTE
jgi:hypothetical protein